MLKSSHTPTTVKHLKLSDIYLPSTIPDHYRVTYIISPERKSPQVTGGQDQVFVVT